MENIDNQLRLNNMLSFIGEIENNCADLTQEQLQEEEFRMWLYRTLAMLGMEAGRVNINHPAIATLKSLEKADYMEGLGKDVYAIFNFIVNDLEYLKFAVADLSTRKVSRRRKSKMAAA